MKWKIPEEIAKKVLEAIKRARAIKRPKVGTELAHIDFEITDLCIKAHTGKTYEELEKEKRFDLIEKTMKHCGEEHGTGFMFEIEHLWDDRPRLAWETALYILEAWARTKLEEW